MHVLHKILVYIPDMQQDTDDMEKNELIDYIRDYTETETEEFRDTVYDWRETATAGRWADAYPCNVLLAKDDVEAFTSELSAAEQFQRTQLKEYCDTFEHLCPDLKVSELAHNLVTLAPDERFEYTSALVALDTISDAMRGVYCIESGYYNTHDETARIDASTYDRVREHPEDWALVMFDYHM